MIMIIKKTYKLSTKVNLSFRFLVRKICKRKELKI